MTRRVVAFMAHPDDAEIAMGGTIARLAAEGAQAHIVIASVPDRVDERMAEAHAAAARLGAIPHILEPPHGRTTWQVEDIPIYTLVARFDRLMSQIDPHLVFTHWDGDTHYDHVRVSLAAKSALRNRRCDFYFAEQSNLYAPTGSVQRVDMFVDISAHMDTRLAAVSAHVSQVSGKTYHELIRSRARAHGERFRYQYAEAFTTVLHHFT